jgi:catalase
VHNYHRDGAMRFDANGGGSVNYEPNSFGGPVEDARFKEPPLPISGDADRYNHREGNDDYKQPGDLFRLMTPDQKQQLVKNLGAAMSSVPREIQLRQLCHFYRADPAYGEGVARELGIDVGEMEGALRTV